MEYRQLGNSGLEASALSFGTATFGGSNEVYKAWGSTGLDEAKRLVDIAIDAGVNLFDSADVYSNGLAEELLGKAIGGRRDRLLISTKAGFRTGPGPDDVGASRRHLVAACDASLRRLGTDYIDLWYVHGFDALTPVEETLRTLDELVRAGKVRHVACSNFSGWQLMKSLALAEHEGWPRYIAHQAYYSLIAREYEWELMPLALDQNVGTVVWSALSGGMLSGKANRHRPAPPGSRIATLGGLRHEFPKEQLYAIIDTLEVLAAELGRSVAQVALNWVLQRPTVASVVIGARNEEQLRDNLRAAEFTLPAELVDRLDMVSARMPVYPYWHQRSVYGERNPPAV